MDNRMYGFPYYCGTYYPGTYRRRRGAHKP